MPFDVEKFIQGNVDQYRGSAGQPGYKPSEVAALIRRAVREASLVSSVVREYGPRTSINEQPHHWEP